MNKQKLANIVDGMPQGMDIDDYLLELVTRALFVERREIMDAIEDHIAGWNKERRAIVLEAMKVIDGRQKL